MATNISRLVSDMNQAKGVVGGAVKSMEASLSTLRSAFATLGVGLGVGTFLALIKGSIDALDHLRDLHLTTKITVEELSGLGVAAKQTGGDLDSVAGSINKLAQNMGKDAEKFKALGITAKDPLEAFKQLSDVFVQLQDPQQRAAVAAEALGKAWQGAAPLLAEGGKKIGEMVTAGAAASGATKELADQADAFNDKLALLKASAGGATTSLVGGLLPTLQLLADNFTLVRNVVLSLIAAKVAGWAAETATELYKTVIANQAKAAATLATAQADATATGAAVALTTARIAELRAAAAAAGGQSALAIVTNGLVPMQARAAVAAEAHAVALTQIAVAQRAASMSSGIVTGALGLLGGPLGWITLLLGLGATAWSLWGKSSEDASKQAENSVARGLAVAKRLQDQIKFGSGDTGVLNEAIVAAKQNLATELANFESARAIVTSNTHASAASIAKDLADVDKAYSGAIGGARATLESLQTAIEKTKTATGELTAEQKKAADAAAAFLSKDKDKSEKLASAELLKYENALKSLEDQLGKYNNQTVEQKMVNDLARGSLKGLSEGHQQNLIQVARQVDLHNTAKIALDAYIKSMEVDLALEQEVADLMAARATKEGEAIKAQHQIVEEMKFEAQQIGKTGVLREKAIKLRALETSGIDKQSDEYARLKVAITEGVQAKTAAEALDRTIIEQIQFETKLIGLNTVEREQAIAVRALEKTGIDQNTEAYKAYVAELKGAIAEKNFAEESKTVLVGMWQDIDRVAKDTFVSIFDAGKNTWERLRDSLKNTLYALLYQMTVRPFLVNVVTSTAGAGVSQQVFGSSGGALGGGGGGGGGGGMDSISNLLSGGNTLYNQYTGSTGTLTEKALGLFGLGASTGAGLTMGTTGALISGGLGASGIGAGIGGITTGVVGGLGVGGIGASMAGFGTGVVGGVGLSAAGAGGAAALGAGAAGYTGAAIGLSAAGAGAGAAGAGIAGTAAAGAAMGAGAAGAGAMAAAAIPYIGWAIAAYMVVKSLFGGGKKIPSQVIADTTGIADSLTSQLKNLVDALDGTTNMSFKYDANTGRNSENPNFSIAANDAGGNRVFASGENYGELVKLTQENLALYGSRAVLAALKASELPEYLRGFFNTLKPESMDQAAIDNALAYAGVLKQINEMIKEFSKIATGSGVVNNDLVAMLGKLPNAMETLNSYYGAFFTDSERMAQSLDKLNQAMFAIGVTTLPKTRAEFRALVEAQDVTTQAGRNMFVSLMQLAPAFASLTTAIDSLAITAVTTADKLAQMHLKGIGLVNAQVQASEQLGNAARQSAQAYRQVAQSIAEALLQLRGGELSPLLPGQKLDESRSALESVFGAAQRGDIEALGRLPEAATKFLEASRAFNASSTTYTADFERVMGMLSVAGIGSMGAANLQDQRATLIEIQTGVLQDIQAELAKPLPSTEILLESAAMLASIKAAIIDPSVVASDPALLKLVSTTVVQVNQFDAMLSGISEMVELLRQMVSLTDLRTGEEKVAVAQSFADATEARRVIVERRAAEATASAEAAASAAAAAERDRAEIAAWFAERDEPDHGDDAAGLPYVPYDGYMSSLHKGEIIVDPGASNYLRKYGIQVHGGGSGGITKEDIDRLFMAVENGNALIAQLGERSSNDIQKQTNTLVVSGKENARDIGYTVVGASEAMERR